MNLTDCIKNLCLENNTSISKLEKTIGIANGNIRNWDTSPPSYDKLQAVADYFEVSIDWMLNRRQYIEFSIDEKELLGYYRSTNNTGKQITLQNARTNAELMPLKQKLSNLKKVSNLNTSASNS